MQNSNNNRAVRVTERWFFANAEERAKANVKLRNREMGAKDPVYAATAAVKKQILSVDCPDHLCTCWVPKDNKIPFVVKGIQCYAEILAVGGIPFKSK